MEACMDLLIMRSAHPQLAKPEGRGRGEREREEKMLNLGGGGGGGNGRTRMYESRGASRMFTW